MTTQTLIHDTTIVTGDDAGSVRGSAALLIEGDRISAIGPTAELTARHPGSTAGVARCCRASRTPTRTCR
jgi:predicted amidohydrolase YtcJ